MSQFNECALSFIAGILEQLIMAEIVTTDSFLVVTNLNISKLVIHPVAKVYCTFCLIWSDGTLQT